MTSARWVVCFVVVSAGAARAAECEALRVRDTGPLAAAAAQDSAVAASFTRAATACATDSEACDQARLECGALLAAALKAQIAFDDGAWLRDMLLPFQGQGYQVSRVFSATPGATDTSCNGAPALLTQAAARRTQQAARREAILSEYPKYSAWAQGLAAKCKESSAVEQARAAQAKAEAEQAAALAAAAKGAEELKQQQAAQVKARPDAEARARADADAKARAELEARAKAQADAQAAQVAEQQLIAKKRAEAEVKARADAEARAQKEAEARQVAEREAKKQAARQQKEQLLAAAQADEASAEAQAAHRRQSAAEAAAHEEEAEREAAKARYAEARRRADGVPIDDSDERSRGSLGLAGGGGVVGTGSTAQGAAGGLALLHLGFWGTAPAQGLASGFEVRLLGRFLVAPGRFIDTQATARYFFGPLGVGVSGQMVVPSGPLSFGVGPALGITFVDTPSTRVQFNAAWHPIGTSVDLARTVGDLELSWKLLLLDFSGGASSASVNGATQVSWWVGGFVGVRFHW
jgi:hypothetical protein